MCIYNVDTHIVAERTACRSKTVARPARSPYAAFVVAELPRFREKAGVEPSEGTDTVERTTLQLYEHSRLSPNRVPCS